MAALWQKAQGAQSPSVRYSMVPRKIMNFIEHDIGIMANWIERTGYGANLQALKVLANELDITITPFSQWLRKKASRRPSSQRHSSFTLTKRSELLPTDSAAY